MRVGLCLRGLFVTLFFGAIFHFLVGDRSNQLIAPESGHKGSLTRPFVGRQFENAGLSTSRASSNGIDGTPLKVSPTECQPCAVNPFGSDCPLDHRTTVRWLPDVDPNVLVGRFSTSDRSEKDDMPDAVCADWDTVDSDSLLGWVEEVQFPAQCAERPASVFRLREHGFVGALTFVKERVMDAMRLKNHSVFMIGGGPTYTGGQTHCSGDELDTMQCFLLPLSGCPVPRPQWEDILMDGKAPGVPRMANHDWVPAQYAKLGKLWFHSQVMGGFVWRLAPHFQKLVDSVRAEITFDGSAASASSPDQSSGRADGGQETGGRGLAGSRPPRSAPRGHQPIIGMHVRHGDRCKAHDQLCFLLDHHVAWAEVLRAKYGVSRIFLATDDWHVIEQTRLYPQFEWVFWTQNGALRDRMKLLEVPDHVTYSTDKQWLYNIEHKMWQWAGKQAEVANIPLVVDSIIVDTSLLADCDYLIGSFSSAVFRGALQLATYRGRRVPPFVSLDRAWCSHWDTRRPVLHLHNPEFNWETNMDDPTQTNELYSNFFC